MERLPRIGDLVQDRYGLLCPTFFDCLVLDIHPSDTDYIVEMIDREGYRSLRRLNEYTMWSWDLLAEAEE